MQCLTWVIFVTSTSTQSWCRSFKGYEEVVVPAVRPALAPAGEELVRITDMEEWAQLAFAGYK